MAKIMVLGLLIKQPMYGYEINEYLKISHADRWSDILPGSIYYALKTLSDDGYIQIKDTQFSGNRNKAIYEITPAGKQELISLLSKSWKDNFFSYPKKMYTLLAFIHYLPQEEIINLIDLQIEKYKAELQYWDIDNIGKEKQYMDDISKLVFLNGKNHLEIDIKLLEALKLNILKPQEERLYDKSHSD